MAFIAISIIDHPQKYEGANQIFVIQHQKQISYFLNKSHDFLTNFSKIKQFGIFAIQLGIQQYDPKDDQFQPDISHKRLSDQDAIIYKINLRDEFYDENNKPFEDT